MKKTKKIICFAFLAAALATAVYAVGTYNYDLQFYPHVQAVLCITVFPVCAVLMTEVKKGLLPLIICTAAVGTAGAFYPSCLFLIFPQLLIICLFGNITGNETDVRACRAAAFTLDGLTFIPFFAVLIKAAGTSAGEALWDSVFDYVLRALAFAVFALCLFIFIRSFSVIKTKSPSTAKKKNGKEKTAYPERLHTVYLLAALNSLADAVFFLFTDDNALVCSVLIAWLGCFAALIIRGEPVLCGFTEKAARFFGLPS